MVLSLTFTPDFRCSIPFFQFEIQGRVIKYKAKGRVHSFKEPWVYDGTAWDVLTGISEKAKHYKSKQGAIEHAVVKLMERLKREGMIRDELWLLPAPPPSHIEPGGTYAFLGKRIYTPPPPISCIGYHWQLQKAPCTFSRLSREIFPRLRPNSTPLSRENGNAHAAPSCIRLGGGGGAGDML